MSKIYHPSTPVANRVLEGHFGEAVMPAAGIQPGPVYVYDAGIRIWHWVTFLAIIVLCVTGYFIGSPPPSIGGEAYDHYMFGWIRFTHFAAGMILGVAFLLRLYRVLVGGPHARQIFYIPFWNLAWWKEIFEEVKWYLFIGKPKEYVGHNPLAHFAMFTMFILPMFVLLFTGFALYAEGAGVQTGWYTLFGWVFLVLGDSMTVHTWHHVAMWVVIIFSMVHMYMAIREDMTHRQTAVSAMISGWRFFR
jgi:Ni/Fe-hydrogenase 1 B-type cytochrome subunit